MQFSYLEKEIISCHEALVLCQTNKQKGNFKITYNTSLHLSHRSLVSKSNLKGQTRSFSAASQILSTFASDKPLIPVRFCKPIHELEQQPYVQNIEEMKASMQVHKQDINLCTEQRRFRQTEQIFGYRDA
jgi:hypothetical protein